MKIVIESIPHDQHRYPTVGDYWEDKDGTQQIRVSAMRDPRYEVLVALHELIEYYLCLQRGIKEEDIMAFDKTQLNSSNPYVEDPGHNPAAPYHSEHVFAECVERLVARELGVNWQDYEKALDALED